MRYKFYREHKYVSFALNDLEREIAKADFRDPKQLEQLREGFENLLQMLRGHAEYENTVLHKLLRKKGSTVFRHAEEEHRHADKELKHLHELLEKIGTASNSDDRMERGYEFYLAYRKFVGENLLHLHEEEALLLPELQKLYSDDELRAVEFETYERMTPEQMVHMMEVLFPHMNPSDHEAFLRDIKDAQPEKFAIVWPAIQSLFRPSEQNELMAKLHISGS